MEYNETLCIDASLTGIGGVWKNRVYASPILDIPDLKIVHLEMINILIAIRIWANHWQYKTVTFSCDNMAVVQVVHSGKTKDPMLAACIRNIWLEASIHDITIKIEHIKGKNNVIGCTQITQWILYSSTKLLKNTLGNRSVVIILILILTCNCRLDRPCSG